MKESGLRERTFHFGVRIVHLFQYLQNECGETILSRRVLESGTAVGALTTEAMHARTTADFVTKLEEAATEANKALYWLELLQAAECVEGSECEAAVDEARTLAQMIRASVKTLDAEGVA